VVEWRRRRRQAAVWVPADRARRLRGRRQGRRRRRRPARQHGGKALRSYAAPIFPSVVIRVLIRVFFLGAVWVRNAGLQGQGEGALVVGIRSEAARGGGVFALHFHFELLVDV